MDILSDSTPVPEGELPSLRVRDGAIYADSRDVASYFGRMHKNVIAAIRELNCSDDFRRLNFQPFKIRDLTGESTSHYEMTKDGFAFAVMGFTGEKAGKFKEAYISRFNEMEAALRAQVSVPSLPDLTDPVVLTRLLIEQAQGRIEDQRRAAEAEAALTAVQPDLAAMKRIGASKGSLCITDAAKTIDMTRDDLLRWMVKRHWIYKRSVNTPWVAHQTLINSGHMSHSEYTYRGRDGLDHTRSQARVTPKGMLRLAKAMGIVLVQDAQGVLMLDRSVSQGALTVGGRA